MKTPKLAVLALLSVAAIGWNVAALADTREASCQVKKDGEKVKGKSGPCTFGQRQGYITIDLKNGDVVELRPGNGADQYKDQNGNKVRRTDSGSSEQTFRWENGKHLVVSLRPESADSGDLSHGDYGINRLDDGGFEVVWSKPFCIGRFSRKGKAVNYTDGCTDKQRKRSYEIAQQQK